jgi:hypothetical protein
MVDIFVATLGKDKYFMVKLKIDGSMHNYIIPANSCLPVAERQTFPLQTVFTKWYPSSIKNIDKI